MDIESIIRAVGEPMRYRIWCCLLGREYCVRSLSNNLGVSESAISQHLKIVREARLVYGEKCGCHTHYLPQQKAIDLLLDTVRQMREQWLHINRGMSVCQCEFREESEK